ncbi:hypothetical protein WOLCODRAFT_148308 [Wolfiporia cocos MD-104 SS10]|uniref:FAD linked oxidase N-terminal domain-containing protein n=1 Tax=Wolfiporia cocos (strain MD-104) TaxID=742152 RepID=A0A2H3JC37_WOLCO|nr:hypothetical protein WOLCODRAFT_148308 [Wolfiporia cocos MD-104 SS10]
MINAPADAEYTADIYHYASSSSENAACSVEPGTKEDVGTIVKGGGHTMNPGFSSTTGVQTAMSRFFDVRYDESTQTAEVGAGCLWNEVYAALDPHGVNVVCGRVVGVGVAGFTLGGAFELVLPNGAAISVTETSEPELVFGLQGGGYNNFVKYGEVCQRVFGGAFEEAVNAATANFAKVTDPKASAIMAYNRVQGKMMIAITLFYDGPTPPAAMFDQFLAIPSVHSNIGTR